MAYFALQAQSGYLFRERDELDPDLSAAAETWADRRVDHLFADWTRTTWTGAGVPDQISEIAELFGSGHYLELAYLGNGDTFSPEQSWGMELKSRAESLATIVLSQGGPRDSEGEIIDPATTVGSDPYGIEIYPT